MAGQLARLSTGLRTRLVLLVAVAALPALAMMAYEQSMDRHRARERTLEDNLRLTQFAASEQASVFTGAQRFLQTLAQFLRPRSIAPGSCNELLATLLRGHPGYLNLVILDIDGTVLCSSSPTTVPIRLNDRPWFQRVMRERTTVLGEYQIGRITGTPDIVVAHPAFGATGDVEVVLAVALELTQLDRVASTVRLPAGATLTLFDRTRTILARYPNGAQWIGKQVPETQTVERLRAGAREDIAEEIGVDGVPRLYVTVPVQAGFDTNLFVGVGIDHAAAFAEADYILRRQLWLLALISAAVIGAAVIGGEKLVIQPINVLKTVTGRVAAGDLGARAPRAGGVQELSALGDAINSMAAALEGRQHDREQFEGQLQASETRYRLLFEQNPHPMWAYDIETLKFLEVNDAAIHEYGYSRDEFLAMRITDIRPAEDSARLLAGVAETREPWGHSGSWRHRLKSGRIIVVEIISHSLILGGRSARLVVAQDLTERRLALEQIRLLARAIESSNEMVSVTDVNDRFTFVNRAFLKTYGYTAEEVIGQAPELLRSPDTPRGVVEQIRRDTRRGGGWHGELLNRRKDGTDLFISLNTSLVENDEGQTIGLLGVARDISERLHAERALHEAQERMRFALEASHVGVWEANLKSGTSYWSDICEVMHGLAPGTFAGTLEAFIDRIHPEDREQTRQMMNQATSEHRDAELEYRTIWPDGTEHRISATGHFYYDDAGTPIRGAGVAIDVTERRSLEDQFRQAQKMEAVGQLAGGIAHDFNNMLTAILGNAEFVLESLPADDERRLDIEEISRAAGRAADLTHQLLAFSRKQILTPCVLHLGDVVSAVTPMLRRLLGETIDLKATVSERGNVKADAGQVEQILVNLAVNASDAMPYGGRLTIETVDVVLDDAYPRQHPTARPGPHVMIAVSDTGHGMDVAIQKRAFEPFFTTKAKGRGTGLGLATVYGIVKQSGGHIWLYSEVGRGTTFKIYLPRTTEAEEVHGPAPTDARKLRGNETVLLVEDEDVVREFVSKVLNRYGYTVHAMPSPRRAIEFAAAHVGRINMILTDVVLPEMTGRTMVTALQQRLPEAKVLYMSGYTDDAIVHNGILDPEMSFLPKPFTVEALAKKVRAVLDTPSTERALAGLPA